MSQQYGQTNIHSSRGVLSTINEAQWKSGKEIFLSWMCIALTLFATMVVAWEQYPIINEQIEKQQWTELTGHAFFLVIVGFLIYGSLVYQSTRLGYLNRLRRQANISSEALNQTYQKAADKPLTVLVPSYKEERRVIFQTLLSAALQEHPNRRVVLCLDDPPKPGNANDAAHLAEARELPAHIMALLNRPAFMFSSSINTFNARRKRSSLNLKAETRLLANLWKEAANWFETQANEYEITDHTDQLFVEKIFVDRARKHNERSAQLTQMLAQDNCLSEQNIIDDYYKLGTLFSCDVSSFERKRYENLSHEPNKAMNLNSYIGLTGKHYLEEQTDDGLFLIETTAENASLSAPATDYFITLDADSLLLPEYALKLIHIMEQPGNERIAVAQTPYSAIPGAPSELERVAGATTDMQYIIHQGFTQHNATYWVGANALLRSKSLNDIVTLEQERGHTVKRYIQDRTVIEDTESSVDLAAKGWMLHNHPQRLAYSATPPDFGSLCIQRQRWANGGLIILPKLLAYLAKSPVSKLPEGLLRVHYLISIAAVNIGLIILLTFPFAESIQSIWLPLTAAPYFFLYGRDLVLCGYRNRDLFKVYALNLLLIPVNIAGVLKSIQQGITGKKIPFGRTPKIQGRTAAAPLYIIFAYLLFLQWSIGAAFDINDRHIAHAIFAALNATFLLYAIRTFIGYKESWQDLTAHFGKSTAQSPALEADASSSIKLSPNGEVASQVEERKYG